MHHSCNDLSRAFQDRNCPHPYCPSQYHGYPQHSQTLGRHHQAGSGFICRFYSLRLMISARQHPQPSTNGQDLAPCSAFYSIFGSSYLGESCYPSRSAVYDLAQLGSNDTAPLDYFAAHQPGSGSVTTVTISCSGC